MFLIAGEREGLPHPKWKALESGHSIHTLSPFYGWGGGGGGSTAPHELPVGSPIPYCEKSEATMAVAVVSL